MTYDVARFRRVMKRIAEDPETLGMPQYGKAAPGCRTTLCLAGHTCVEAGLQLAWDSYDEGTGVFYASGIVGSIAPIHETAAQLLGLTSREADAIFLAVRIKTPAELWDRITEVTGITEHDWDPADAAAERAEV